MTPKLLVADDSVTIQRIIELTFADENIQVIAVGDGQAAIERLESDRPDILLADVGMPGRDGYEVAAWVRGTPHLAHVPVLLLTGAFEPVDEARAQAVGCHGVLVKPFEPQMVINRVKELLAGRRSGAPAAAAAQPGAAAPPPATPEIDPDLPGPDLQDGATSATPEAPAAGGDALEDYFDRLDVAFATLGSQPPADSARAAPGHADLPAELQAFGRELMLPAPDHEWDRPSEPDTPRTAPPADADPASGGPATAIASPRPVPPPPAAAAPGPAEPPPLAEAFAALLAVEQSFGGTLTPTPAAITDDFVEQVTERVLARLGEGTVRESVTSVVLDVAERLVREEIGRIKAGASGT
jgi:CheY-like chemotaxis protein